jgi:hypothetical protein
VSNSHKHTFRTRSLCNNAATGTIIFANADMSVDDAGFTLIPFGIHRHSMGWQQFGKAEAEAICNAFGGMIGKIKRFVSSLPVFKGHPDQKEFANEFPDKTQYGQVAEMEAREDCLAVKMAISNEGEALIRGGLKYISPRWDARQVGAKDGEPVWSPFKMLSIGLVDRPNIPNAKLVNHAPEFMNKAALIALFKLAADATDAQVEAALANAAARPTTETLTNAQTELATAKVALANVTTERDTAATSLSNERKAHRLTLVNAAVKDGRITAADIALWTGRLETGFEAESKVLANMTPTVKTNATTEQIALKALSNRLAAMTDVERAEFIKTGTMANDDDGADMANVHELHALVNLECEGDSCKKIKNPNTRYATAMQNVLKRHPKFLTPANA